MNTQQGTDATKNGPGDLPVIDRNILSRMAKFPGGIARLMAGPPMTEQDRFNQNLVEARGRSDWLRPR